MGRARRARKIAAAAAYGGGLGAAGIGVIGLVGYGVLKTEILLARRLVGQPFEGAPDDEALYGAGPGQPIEFLMLGDSSAAGMGADAAHQTVGAIIANGVAALSGRPVRLTNVAVIGAESSGLEVQLATALGGVDKPDIAVILTGANDVTHRIDKSVAIRALEQTVRELRETGCEVVVGTCPDLGTIEPVAQPLRLLARRWSRDLAAAQTVAVIEGGGRTVSLGDLLGSEFATSSHEMFSHDRFHPSPAGYARVAAVLLPSVCDALGLWPDSFDHGGDVRRTGRVDPVAVAAVQAVRDAGTEVSATAVGGQPRGPRGRWAIVLRRSQRLITGRSEQAAVTGAAVGDADVTEAGVTEAAGIPVPAGEPPTSRATRDEPRAKAGDQAHTPKTPSPQ